MYFPVPGVFPASAAPTAGVKAITLCPGDCCELHCEAPLCSSIPRPESRDVLVKTLKAAIFGAPLPWSLGQFVNLLARVMYLQIITGTFFFKSQFTKFVTKKTSECMQPQQMTSIFPYHLDFQQVWNFFVKYHQREKKKTSVSLWPDQILEWNLKKTMENLPKVFLALTSASYQEQRTTIPVTQLLPNQFATCVFSGFQIKYRQNKRAPGKFLLPRKSE